jgi:hypothetical protein
MISLSDLEWEQFMLDQYCTNSGILKVVVSTVRRRRRDNEKKGGDEFSSEAQNS